MRKASQISLSKHKLFVLDDEPGVIDSLSVIFKRSGYHISGSTDPLEAVERLRNEHFDLLVLDFLMSPIHGDRVVELIREFDRELYILLLTGHKDLAPPLKTIKTLDIQGYCEKSDRFDQLLLLVESGLKSISQRQMIKKLNNGLNGVLQSVPQIFRLQPMNALLESALAELSVIANCNDAFILADEAGAGENSSFRGLFHGTGRFSEEHGGIAGKLGPELLEAIGAARNARSSAVFDDGLILPLLDSERGTSGIIYAEAKNLSESKGFIEIFANLAAAALSNTALHSMLNKKNVELGRAYDLLKQRYMDMVEALRIVVDTKDGYTRGHSDNVSYFAAKIGEKLGLKTHEMETLRIGSLFHDIGKIGIPDNILRKPGRLDQQEFEEIKQHPLKGMNILSSVSMFKDIVPLIKHHHERVDGRGYPDGLRGDEIPLLAKIIAVADAFDAMTSDRTYRPRLSLSQSIDQLKAGSGVQFDPGVVKTLLELLENYDALLEEIERNSRPDPLGLDLRYFAKNDEKK
ncbi:MAG: DUF3369 domain-containing protein [Clostridiales bacterium]|nr:DUF3369 domain-containing protein [Clostridiales bacterium]